MTCYECQEQPGPGGLSFSERNAVGVCLQCGRGACKAHGVWEEAAHRFLCRGCAALPAGKRSQEN